jgi:SAM-dependent methyltransferase
MLGTGPPSDLPPPFLRAAQIDEVLDFFSGYSEDLDPFLQQGGPLPGRCYVCDADVVFEVDRPDGGSPVNWRETMRCPRCGMINRWRACLHLFDAVCSPDEHHRIYLTEALSPLFNRLEADYPRLTASEYRPGLERGEAFVVGHRSVRCEDVTRLTFANRHFDSILCFDVLEHVPDYQPALAEFHRVLERGGHLLLTVPFSFRKETVIRARMLDDGTVEHLLEPCYHGDPLSEEGVLAFYDFGTELLEELRQAGFRETWLVCWRSNDWGYPGPGVAFVARK